jgi:hypothetical protein
MHVAAHLTGARKRDSATLRIAPSAQDARPRSGRMVGELDKAESGPFPGAVYELRVIHAGLPLGWRARCTILELESSNGKRTNRAEEL